MVPRTLTLCNLSANTAGLACGSYIQRVSNAKVVIWQGVYRETESAWRFARRARFLERDLDMHPVSYPILTFARSACACCGLAFVH